MPTMPTTRPFLPLLAPLLALLMLGGCDALKADDGVPYWATIDANRANMRVGPGPDYRVEWTYLRKGLPVRVVREHEGWRLLEDSQGTRGWMASPLLRHYRSGLVVGKGVAPMRERAEDTARIKWRLEPGVVGRIERCEAGWCAFRIGPRTGFVPADRLWGGAGPE